LTEEGAGVLAHVAEMPAIVHNRGEALADETTTRCWVRGPDIDQELRAICTHRQAMRSRSRRCGTSEAVAVGT
jgi:hypothetical protein